MIANQALYSDDTSRQVGYNITPVEGVYTNMGNFNAGYASNDPSIMSVSGNSYTVQMKGQEVREKGAKPGVTSLRINISGTVVQTFNLCCWIWTIVMGSIFLFPLFFVCCGWWKRKALPLSVVDRAGYEGVASLIENSGAAEVYLTVQDNYLDAAKAQILIGAIARSRIQNFSMVNIATGFNTDGKNYSDFHRYMLPIYQYVKFGEIRWARKLVR